MTIKWISGGQQERIPQVGSRLKIKEHLFFEVEGYGESKETSSSESKITGVLYELELHGKLVVPAGSPIEVLEELLRGGL